jgi:hypothetical protein
MIKKRKKELERALSQMDSKRRLGILDGPFIQKQAEKKEGVAFVIKDVYNGDLEIKESANGWWMEEDKLEKLLQGLSDGHTIKTACALARVSRAQWQYFNKVHPEFMALVEIAEDWQTVRAIDTVNANLDDLPTARWLLEKRHPKFKTKLTLSDIQGLVLPSMNTNLGIYEEGDPESVAAQLIQVAETLLAQHKAKKKKEEIPAESETISHSQDEQK